jgi:hypothetical protein
MTLLTRTITCVTCGKQEQRFSCARATSFCHDCQRQHAREQRAALSRVYAAVKRGLLPRASDHGCADCDSPATDYDHRDYTKPLDVEPVCRSCNIKRGPAYDSVYRPAQQPA